MLTCSKYVLKRPLTLNASTAASAIFIPIAISKLDSNPFFDTYPEAAGLLLPKVNQEFRQQSIRNPGPE